MEVGAWEGNRVQVTVNGATYAVEVQQDPAARNRISTRPSSSGAPGAGSGARSAGSTAPPAALGDSSGEVRAPMAGVVLSIAVSQGQSVVAGDELMVLEAMKMENKIRASCDAVVTEILVQPQQSVNRGDLLLTLATG